WTSPIYTFFDDKVETVTDSPDSRKYQAFKCKAPGGCKSKSGALHMDLSSTSSLKKHAKQCWGSDLVEAHIRGVAADANRDGSIFAAFARSGQCPVNTSHYIIHTPSRSFGTFYYFSSIKPYLLLHSARLIRWITEANQPLKIVQDRQLEDLLTAGWPELKVPSCSIVMRDLKAVYEH
ncbi:hypothetical protein C8J57DRAFT_1075719, partial [Mycena rebaudengoi]